MPIGPPPSHILEETVGDEIVLYDSTQEVFVALNTTAADVWRLATGDLDFDQMLERIAAAYDVSADQIRAQVESTVRELVESGLLPAPT